MFASGSNASRCQPTIVFRAAPVFERSQAYWLTCCLLLIWWLASLYPLMGTIDISEGLKDAAGGTARGSLANQLLVVSFALLGAAYLMPALRRLLSSRSSRHVLVLLGGYLAWSLVTILWSDDVALSIRRLGQLLLLIVGAVGLGAGFYSQTRAKALAVARHVLYASLIAVAVLIASRIWSQNLSELLSPDWDLKNTTQAEFYVYPVAYGIIAALVLFRGRAGTRFLSTVLLGLVLLLLKGRSMIAGTLAASLLVGARLGRPGFLRASTRTAGMVLLGLQIDLASGGNLLRSSVGVITNVFGSLLPYLTIGNGVDDLVELSGREPLWQSLWTYYQEHMWIGHGFGAFWTPNRFDEIYKEVGWRAVVAHNGFLDELLATGIIGLVLALAFWLQSMRVSARIAADRYAASLVVGWLLLFLLFNSMGSIMQSYFQAPTIFSLTALFALLAQPADNRLHIAEVRD